MKHLLTISCEQSNIWTSRLCLNSYFPCAIRHTIPFSYFMKLVTFINIIIPFVLLHTSSLYIEFTKQWQISGPQLEHMDRTWVFATFPLTISWGWCANPFFYSHLWIKQKSSFLRKKYPVNSAYFLGLALHALLHKTLKRSEKTLAWTGCKWVLSFSPLLFLYK